MFDIHRPYLQKCGVATLIAAVVIAQANDALGQAVSILESTDGNSQDIPPNANAEELPLPQASIQFSRSDSEPNNPKESANPSRQYDSPVRVSAQPLDRVSIHEAFATVPQSIVSAGPIVPQAPPQEVIEKPIGPQRKGTNVNWIGGYWAWHADRTTYYWVSGFWREIPPGRSWVPGKWFAAPGGYQWSHGYWANNQKPAVLLSSRPPNVMDRTSNSSAPGIDSFWVPPKYVWRNDTYTLQPGYWTKHQDQFVWQPATYIQTQQGYILLDGYWDFELEVRGIPYAPLSVPIDVASQTPIIVEPELLLAPNATICIHMFMQPGDSHYYFGNYYTQVDLNQGLLPWYDPRGQAYSASALASYYQRKFSLQGISFAAAASSYASRYRAVTGARPILQPVSIGGRGYAITDQLSSGAPGFSQLLAAGTRVAAQRPAVQPRAANSPGPSSASSREGAALPRRSTAEQQAGRANRSPLPQPDRSLGRSLGRVPPAVVVPPGVVLPRGGVSISITGGWRGAPPVLAPGFGVGIPIPPRPASRIGIGIPVPGIAPISPPALRRGFRR